VGGAARRRLPPELVDQAVGGHDLSGAEQQEGEQGALLRRTERDRDTVAACFQRTEDPKLQSRIALSHRRPDATAAESG
jgi:hypothetical protein